MVSFVRMRLLTIPSTRRANKIRSYSTAPEIHRYFKEVADKYGLYKYVKLQHFVSGASWDEQNGIWNVEIKNMRTGTIEHDWGHILVNGSGVLKYPRPWHQHDDGC